MIKDVLEKLKGNNQLTNHVIDYYIDESNNKDDPLVTDYENKNLLAWFGFEETVNNLYENVYESLKNNNFEYEY